MTRPPRTDAERRLAADKLIREGRPVSTGTAALLLAVDVKTVARWCRDGRIEHAGKTPGGHWRIPASEVARHVPGTRTGR